MIIRFDLMKYKLLFNCYENYINFLQQIRDNNKVSLIILIRVKNK
jgi:hypothetical protein